MLVEDWEQLDIWESTGGGRISHVLLDTDLQPTIYRPGAETCYLPQVDELHAGKIHFREATADWVPWQIAKPQWSSRLGVEHC